MANSIDFARNYTAILDEVYQRAGVSSALNSGRRIVRAGRNAKEIMIPKISVSGVLQPSRCSAPGTVGAPFRAWSVRLSSRRPYRTAISPMPRRH